ncbi:hypothetical protein EDC30_109134 [Paucimonas lemoignei]|uniref:Uncharacterized protein n=1 Tax=Paucimonas lemoignei TaxID=29443 RepID=A0A4R3HUW9_PAULE|nr:hypothetical protein [Paucimonas lemoignei]TCS35835.1 hypothetical protein EDC30_109134 [Paucimonas lemoignei]
MTNEKVPVVCDCINWCGDDPWLRDGRSKPCAAALKRQAIEQNAAARAIARFESWANSDPLQHVFNLAKHPNGMGGRTYDELATELCFQAFKAGPIYLK